MALFIRIFIYLDVLIIGALLPIVYKHAYAHFKPQKHDPEQLPQVPQNIKELMVHKSETQYQEVLDNSIKQLQRDLLSSSEQINGMLKQFAGDIIGEELEKYRNEIARLHRQAEVDMSGIKTAVSSRQAEIEDSIAHELAAEKQAMLKQIDVKLGDAVASFLLETLQHNVDLGSQRDYLVAMLEEHKDDLKQGVVDEIQPAK